MNYLLTGVAYLYCYTFDVAGKLTSRDKVKAEMDKYFLNVCLAKVTTDYEISN